MPNPEFSENFNDRKQSAVTNSTPRENSKSAMPEKTANWPTVPGKTQGKDRSGGVKKVKIHPASQGL